MYIDAMPAPDRNKTPTKNIQDDFPVLAFIDIETTGSNFERDRITEIGIKTLVNNEVTEWESLLDPETFIPQNIQRLTGISPAMVAGKPNFNEIAHQLKNELAGKIFVAHNARFDYGFIKASFKRMDMDFRPKVLCTVKLSRLLFPQQTRHNLDTIIATHNLVVSSRHRAMGDADLLLQFWRVCEATVGQERLLAAVNQLVGSVSLPPNINQSVIDAIPDTCGCYVFYGEHNAPLYIGKSINMRSRVMSHFQSALTVRKEMKLSLQVFHIDWIETSGELTALLMESRLIKEQSPSMNIKLRKSKDLSAWQLVKDSLGMGEVSLEVHNLNLETALSLFKVQVWPFDGAIAIKDGDCMVVVDKWCYLGIARDHDELYELARSGSAEFDLDIYKILKKSIAGSHKHHVIKLNGING